MLNENENYLESIIENSYDGIYITDSKGLTLKVNKSYERITGIDREKLIGKYVKDLADKGLLSVYLTDKVVKEKSSITINQKINNKMLTITGNPILDKNGDVTRVITNVRDITDILTLEKQLRISQEMANIYRQEVFEDVGQDNIVCKSQAMQQVFHLAKKIAPKNSTALILGETGVGKEVVAKYIHTNSSRSEKNYVKINCGAIPENLLESELFGYVGGAFTGANPKGKLGMFELANEGTLFLDEIGELPMNLQSSLLRVLQDNEVTRVGDTASRKVDVRIIAATNKNLEEMIESREFRSDLFYRLNVISVFIPPLRERIEDISDFAELFIGELNNKYGDDKILTQEFVEKLLRRDWPGNVRELANFIEKQYVMTDSNILNDFISLDQHSGFEQSSTDGHIQIKGMMPLSDAVKYVEKTLINRAMDKVHNTHKAAKLLNMSQPTFFRKLKEYRPNEDENED
jgi:PAS domain S-box-containing protein